MQELTNTLSLPLSSFPSNELNNPPPSVIVTTGFLLCVLIFYLTCKHRFSLGVLLGGTAFAIAAGALFWPRVLREPRAPDPGPFVVITAAILGSFLGGIAALVGKLFAVYSKQGQMPNPSGLAANPVADDGSAYCSLCKKSVSVDADDRCVECKWPIDEF